MPSTARRSSGRTSSRPLAAAALAGAATGLRSTAGLAALVQVRSAGLPAAAVAPPARALAGIAVSGELVTDALPNTPSRLEVPGLVARVTLAAIAGVVIARATEGHPLPAALVAATVAVVSARVGHDVRQAAARRVPPIAAAVVEDAVALALALAAARSAG